MNVDHILDTLNREGVNYLLIGGMNFLLRHKPIVTLDISKLLAEEEARRDRMWPAAERWRVLQETIAWADAQQPVPRNSKESCLARQAELLSRMAAAKQRKAAQERKSQET